MAFVYKSDPVRGAVWARLFAERAPQVAFHIWPETGDPAAVRFLAAWIPPPDLTRLFPNLEVLFSAAAGIDQFDLAALPPDLPIVRMIEPGIVRGMVEYVCWAVLGLHRDMPAYLRDQRAEAWTPLRVLPAAGRRVGVLGLGVLGCAVLEQLRGFGFDCAGWSRSRHDVAGAACFAGQGELPAFLARTDILVCLLPLTADTRGMLDARLFAGLPRGAGLVQVGRGPQLVEADLRAALDAGQLGHAILDVCDPEPLPPGHWLWRHPKVWLTPHIASMTQPESAVEVVLENLRRFEAGEPMVGLVDRGRGY
ncbi:MAG: glyoxylate/hydroxypyruvate reductase A [Betaproteobacteria bacterium]|nr:glyoxylate/hydroxypyruvate reductase A [Betaproteobacteria bacterium]